MIRALTAALLAAAACLAGSAAAKPRVDSHARTTPDSGVRGDVRTGPTCPVERDPPDPACAPRPFDTVVRVRSRPGGKLVRQVETGDDGRFRVRLAPGRYRLSPRSGSNGFPRCSAEDVTVEAHRFTRVHLMCDTGIR